MPEFSERAREVTEQVRLWVANDRDVYFDARKLAQEGSPAALGDFLIRVIKAGKPYSAPWQVAQELAPNDYARINWKDIMEDLIGD